jgi:hypothetical protein
MRSRVLIAIIAFASAAAALSAQDSPTPVTTNGQATWTLTTDLLATANQISFNQGSRGVWYFLESRTFVHDALTYRLLPEYRSPCLSYQDPSLSSPDGVSCWIDPAVDATGNSLPLVALNATRSVVRFPDPYDIPPRSVYLHPGTDRLAIVGWKSPVNGRVTLEGSFVDLDTRCGNGVLWSIDKHDTTLKSGDLPGGGVATFHVRVNVRRDDALYVIVDPNGDYSCDTTGLELTIARSVN